MCTDLSHVYILQGCIFSQVRMHMGTLHRAGLNSEVDCYLSSGTSSLNPGNGKCVYVRGKLNYFLHLNSEVDCYLSSGTSSLNRGNAKCVYVRGKLNYFLHL